MDESSSPDLPPVQNNNQGPVNNPVQPHTNILNQTLGQLLQQNNQAQGIVMQAMQINPQQLQQLLTATGNNQMMNMPISELLKSVPQGAGQAMQVNPQQMQQIIGALTSQNPQQNAVIVQQGQLTQTPQKQSIIQKVRNLFRKS